MEKLPTAILFTLLASVGSALAPPLQPGPQPGPQTEEPSAAQQTFARYKQMAGTWSGESTMGWRNEVRFQTIAAGSVVMQTSNFEAHPGETMVTMYHLHKGELLLTHYCVAGNQPRLVASEFSADGREVTFTYRDGTGLASRDTGHMDEVLVTFEEDGSYRSFWSWYQAGESSPMEEIRLERVDDE